jgi:pimeloyl-ACP methyl ester carboxylesterase
MAREKVQVIGFSTAEPAQVWAVARDFCGPSSAHWHPAIATMQAEHDAQGHLIRAFTVKGEAKTYRERLTYFSDTDRVYAYSHVQGIEGVEHYDARLSVTAAEKGGSVIHMTANLQAPMLRAKAIATGTEAIFKDAVAALATAAERALGAYTLPPLPQPVSTETQLIDTLPRLAIEVTEAKDGPLCLFLHGIGGARSNWRQQLGVIGHNTRAATLDLRGYGDSTLGQGQSTVDDYCADILRVAQVLGADRLILVGLSYGSWIATSFAMRYPEMLAGLVLSGGCTGMSEAGVAEREAFRVSREVPLNAGQVPADFAPVVVNVIAGPNANATVRAELLASMAAIPVATYRDALLCFTNPLEKFDFSKLTMPVLMMTGEYDRLAPAAEIRGVAERIFDASPTPDVQFEIIPGVGHVCNVEGADAYTRHLAGFVAKVAP